MLEHYVCGGAQTLNQPQSLRGFDTNAHRVGDNALRGTGGLADFHDGAGKDPAGEGVHHDACLGAHSYREDVDLVDDRCHLGDRQIHYLECGGCGVDGLAFFDRHSAYRAGPGGLDGDAVQYALRVLQSRLRVAQFHFPEADDEFIRADLAQVFQCGLRIRQPGLRHLQVGARGRDRQGARAFERCKPVSGLCQPGPCEVRVRAGGRDRPRVRVADVVQAGLSVCQRDFRRLHAGARGRDGQRVGVIQFCDPVPGFAEVRFGHLHRLTGVLKRQVAGRGLGVFLGIPGRGERVLGPVYRFSGRGEGVCRLGPRRLRCLEACVDGVPGGLKFRRDAPGTPCQSGGIAGAGHGAGQHPSPEEDQVFVPRRRGVVDGDGPVIGIVDLRVDDVQIGTPRRQYGGRFAADVIGGGCDAQPCLERTGIGRLSVGLRLLRVGDCLAPFHFRCAEVGHGVVVRFLSRFEGVQGGPYRLGIGQTFQVGECFPRVFESPPRARDRDRGRQPGLVVRREEGIQIFLRLPQRSLGCRDGGFDLQERRRAGGLLGFGETILCVLQRRLRRGYGGLGLYKRLDVGGPGIRVQAFLLRRHENGIESFLGLLQTQFRRGDG